MQVKAFDIYHTTQDPQCRLWQQYKEATAHLARGCNKLPATDCLEKHKSLTSTLYKGMCTKYNLENNKEQWVKPGKQVESKQAKSLWDFPVQVIIQMFHNWPDILLIEYSENGFIIDMVVSRDENIKHTKWKILASEDCAGKTLGSQDYSNCSDDRQISSHAKHNDTNHRP